MPTEMIDAIVKDFFRKVSEIRVGGNGLGELMVSPFFDYFLSRIKEFAIDVELITKAHLLQKTEQGLSLIPFLV